MPAFAGMTKGVSVRNLAFNHAMHSRTRTYWLYILASARNGTLYIGVTNDISRRVLEHRDGKAGSFTTRYGVTKLVWFETFDDINDAILRETQMKKWRRAWKIRVIEEMNPDWADLFETVAL
ncbi:hypothetical protein sos41_23470 [Alphaproteobacteria bacterium SO-S41]|nr:hypothetical protein sos41_23470 [Alphaproteobacteria bacterium SO-S41]